MRVLVSYLIPLVVLFAVMQLGVNTSIITLVFLLLIPFSLALRKNMFQGFNEDFQWLLSVGFSLYLCNIILYALDYDSGRTIMEVISGGVLLILLILIYRVSREKTEELKDIRKRELRYMYLVFNFATLMTLLSHFHSS